MSSGKSIAIVLVMGLVCLPSSLSSQSEANRWRANVLSLSPDHSSVYTAAFIKYKADPGPWGFKSTQSFHGVPNLCSVDGFEQFQCCFHNILTFPLWHRLMTLQMENGLQHHGWPHGLPYWDWLTLASIPEIYYSPSALVCFTEDLAQTQGYTDYTFTPLSAEEVEKLEADWLSATLNFTGVDYTESKNATFYDETILETSGVRLCEAGNFAIVEPNPWKNMYVSELNLTTSRGFPDNRMAPPPLTVTGEHPFVELILAALEETNYCDFEVQMEILHNEIHCRTGGDFSTNEMAAMDPLFLAHHTHIERILMLWEHLQTLRGLSAGAELCAQPGLLTTTLSPYDYDVVNIDPLTRNFSGVLDLFNNSFGGTWDTWNFAGLSVEGVLELISQRQERDRVYAGLVLRSPPVSMDGGACLVVEGGNQSVTLEDIFCFPNDYTFPWAYERIFKFELTHLVDDLDLLPTQLDLTFYVQDDPGVRMGQPLVVVRPARDPHELVIVTFRRSQVLPVKVRVRYGTRLLFQLGGDMPPCVSQEPIEGLSSLTSLVMCSIPTNHLSPYRLGVEHALRPGEYFFAVRNQTLCQEGGRIALTVEEPY